MIGVIVFFLGSSTAVADQKITFMPHWIHQAQFAGIMAAKEKGFFKQYGLDVEILQGGPGKNSFTYLAKGKTTFCSGWLSEAITKRESGIPLVNFCQLMQHSSLMLVAKKSSGIQTLSDLSSRKVGVWAGEFYVPLRALIAKYDLDVKLIHNYTTVTILLEDAVDAVAAMWYNEYHLIINSGFDPSELTTFHMKNLGVDYPEDGIYALEKTADNNMMVYAFIEACLRGWLYAFENEEETLDIVMKYADAANTGTNRAHQRWMLKRMKDLILPDDKAHLYGKLAEEDYKKVGRALQKMYIIKRLPDFNDFFGGLR
ncbi:MAG: ABC transporter substrate-binding protein [Desulfobacteraceae bacterium]|nr:ABC transporter substrate-binding protein [Desulfobacteraceae bacterium]